MGIRFLPITPSFLVQFQKEKYPRAQETSSFNLSPHKLSFGLVWKIQYFGEKMGVAALLAWVGVWGWRPPQKFGHGSYFVGQLLSQF